MDYSKFIEKVKSMSGKEIVLAMVDGLKNPVMKVDMDTFGSKEKGVCYGCAATNFICKVGGFDPSEAIAFHVGGESFRRSWAAPFTQEAGYVNAFEDAIDSLRKGGISSYNAQAVALGLAILPENWDLPSIENDNYQDLEVLQVYIDYANSLGDA